MDDKGHGLDGKEERGKNPHCLPALRQAFVSQKEEDMCIMRFWCKFQA
jgi:hypothetical protein